MRSNTVRETKRRARLGGRLWFWFPALFLITILQFPSGAQEMSRSSPLQTAAERQCAHNLQVIYRLVQLYMHYSAGHMGFPCDFKYIYGMSHEPKDFICPADKQIAASAKELDLRISYEFLNNPLKPSLSKTPPSRIAIVGEKRPNHHKRLVLFDDGSVRALGQGQFEKLKEHSFIDEGANDRTREP